MKKFLSLLIVSIMLIVPLSVHAEPLGIKLSCTAYDTNGYSTCVVTYDIDERESYDNVDITLTEVDGAEVASIDTIAESDWEVLSYSESNNVWTAVLQSPGVTGEGDLFKFTYKKSDLETTRIDVSDGNSIVSTNVVDTSDQPSDNKDTGSALPFVALGTIAIIAVGAYVVTKNKTKMYKI